MLSAEFQSTVVIYVHVECTFCGIVKPNDYYDTVHEHVAFEASVYRHACMFPTHTHKHIMVLGH